MSITRRLFATAMPALPLAAKQAVGHLAGAAPAIDLSETKGFALNGTGAYVDAIKATPKMDHQEVLRLLLNDKELWKELYEKAFEGTKGQVTQLDPDLAANKSYSLTFKVLVQRQRMAEKQVEQALHQNENLSGNAWSIVHDRINKLMWGR
jgi:hypothetical protein